jgi:putative addiction module component (TIGR02574 family)
MDATTDTDQLFHSVLALPRKDRVTLLAILEDSLAEDESTDDVQEAWAAEIRRRIESTDHGDVQLISHEEVQRRLGPKYGKHAD